ncbi:ESX secretion-associated protein EspG [Mycolicibacterium sp. XJ870]
MVGKQMLAAAYLNVDGALFLQRLLGIEGFPTVLALYSNVYYRAEQNLVDDLTVPVLVQSGLLDAEGNVEPDLKRWLRVLERPDMEVSLRAMNGERMRRVVVARRGDEHVMAVRRNDEVVIQAIWSDGQKVEDVVAAPLWAAMRESETVAAPPPARMETVTAPLAEFRRIAENAPGQIQRPLRQMGVDPATARILNELSSYSGQRCEIVIHENRGTESVMTPAGIAVADTSFGRVISGARKQGSQIFATFGSGSYARFRAAVDDLIAMTPSGTWFAATAAT